MTLSARYTGPAHPFYKYGETYTIHTHRTLFGRIRIEVHRGKESVINSSVTRYRDWGAFREDFEEVR